MEMSAKKNVTAQIPFSIRDMFVFGNLIRELRFENRFFPSESSTRFVEGLIRYAKRFKTHSFSKGTKFFRARVHDFKMEPSSFSRKEMGAPPNYKAGNGRLNPAGIPYLYLADSVATAVAEVRPWIDCDLTVAEFELARDLSFVTFSLRHYGVVSPEKEAELDEETGAETTWRELIAQLFSCPFDPRDDSAYAPTQYITERIKKEGFAGIIYDSALTQTGTNIALFDPVAAVPKSLLKVNVLSTRNEMRVTEIREG
jgi:RES domain-containing protein